jgi:tRNA(Ile)-lysidine synthase/bifunctional protein TilS/HprT
MKNLVDLVQEQNYISENEAVVLALSGGVDSMVLLHVLYQITPNIIVCHVNHNKRQASFDEFEEIKRICQHKNIVFKGIVLDDQKGNFHEESRNKRFSFFTKIAKEYGAKKVFLAHHADDQLETILMRLVRGSSFTGYSGMKDVREFNSIQFVRPFLSVSKQDILDYSNNNNVTYFEDESNQKDDYTRNRFRHHIVPLLQEEQPQLIQKVEQFTQYLSSADAYINKESDAIIKEHFSDGTFPIDVFNSLDYILQIKILKKLINSVSFNTVEVSYQQYSDMIKILNNSVPNASYSLNTQFSLIKVYNHFYIGEDITKKSVFLEIKNIGEYIISRGHRFIISNNKMDISHTDSYELWYNKSVFPLYLRTRQNGDKMDLKIGTKKVKDILIDQKVPKQERDNLILVANNDIVLWIPTIKKGKQDSSLKNTLYLYEVKDNAE